MISFRTLFLFFVFVMSTHKIQCIILLDSPWPGNLFGGIYIPPDEFVFCKNTIYKFDGDSVTEFSDKEINKPDESGFFPLHRAIFDADPHLVELLLDHGAHVDQLPLSIRDTPLLLCIDHIVHSNVEAMTTIAQFLIQNGANVNARSLSLKTGKTALHEAMSHNGLCLDLIYLLVLHGADIHAVWQYEDGSEEAKIEKQRTGIPRIIRKIPLECADPEYRYQIWMVIGQAFMDRI